MNTNVEELINRFRSQGVLVDTNLLLLLLVGNVDQRLIGEVGRTQNYQVEDYLRLRQVLVEFERVVFLPQILSEVGNLMLKNCPTENTRYELLRAFERFVMSPDSLEARMTSRKVVSHVSFSKVGYTDAAILAVARGRYLVLTADGPLQGIAQRGQADVLPFQWLRT